MNVVKQNKRAAATLLNAEPVFDWLAVAVDGFGRKETAPALNLLAIGDAAAFIDPFTGSGMLMALEGSEILAEIVLRNDFKFEQIRQIYRLRQRRKFQRRLRVCSVLRRMSLSPKMTTLAVTALGFSGRSRELLARSTRNALSGNDSAR